MEKLRKKKEPAHGVDRTMMRELLKLTPTERLRLAEAEARELARLDAALRRQ